MKLSLVAGDRECGQRRLISEGNFNLFPNRSDRVGVTVRVGPSARTVTAEAVVREAVRDDLARVLLPAYKNQTAG